MPRFDVIKALSQTGDSIKQLSVLNPLTIYRKGTKTKAAFALAMVCFFWGTTWLASEQGVKRMPGIQLAGIRQLIAGVIYVIYFLSKGVKLPKGKEWGPVFILSILNFALSNGLSTWGVQYISAGLGAIIGAIFPIWLVVIGLFLSSKIPVKAIIGLILGFGGVCIVFYEHFHDFFNSGFRLGITLSILSTWSWAFGTLYTKKQVASFNPYFSLGLQMLISGTFLVTLTKTTGIAIPVTSIPWQSWACLAYLILVGSIFTFICYIYALQHLPTEQISIYAYINPIVAVILGWLILNEKMSVFIGIGGLVALLGVYLVNKAFKAVPASEQPATEGV
ncbi:MAG: drug/metabolite-transporting permease [Sphingobacteriales bacterium UTBCD1]|jgi:drug/metabolite transporter (DMT)-like permease|nr:MAG: drug/metabolite-transporting permease [Sphingobacteriales bacterium UTBCD1]